MRATIPFFRKVSRASSQGVWLAIEFSWSEDYLEVVLGQFLIPSCLASGEEAFSGKRLQVMVVSNDCVRSG